MSKKILIIEDDAALYNLYRIALEMNGYSVSNVSDGALAFEASESQQPDLILLDLMLPNKGGLQILEELGDSEATIDIPVVMLTNYGTDENVTKALDLGAEDYIMKYNITPSDLAEKVATILRDLENPISVIGNDNS